MEMNLKDLRYFVVVAESGSILAASDRLHVAQPSLSARIRSLEGDLGVQLFDRRPRGVVLTPEGEELLDHARHILQSAAVAKESIRMHAGSPVGTVHFGVPSSLASALCVPLIERAAAELPNVRLQIVDTMSGAIIGWLRNGELDVGLVFGEGNVPGLRLEPLLVEELFVAANSFEALAGVCNDDGEIPLEALAQLPLILPTGRHGLRILIDQYLRRSGTTSRVIIEIDAFGQIQRLVQRGRGVTILSLAALHDAGLEPPLVTARIVSPSIDRTVSLAVSEERLQTKATRAVGALAARILRAQAIDDWWQARLL